MKLIKLPPDTPKLSAKLIKTYTKTCKACNTSFETKKVNQKFCSRKCYKNQHPEISKEELINCSSRELIIKYGVDRQVLNCKRKSLGITNWNLKGSQALKVPVKTANCKVCNKPFNVPNTNPKQTLCSVACRHLSISKRPPLSDIVSLSPKEIVNKFNVNSQTAYWWRYIIKKGEY